MSGSNERRLVDPWQHNSRSCMCMNQTLYFDCDDEEKKDEGNGDGSDAFVNTISSDLFCLFNLYRSHKLFNY